MGFDTTFCTLEGNFTQNDVVRANALYHNNAANTYDEENRTVGTITERGDHRLREVFEQLKTKGARGPVLDFGTGTGHLLQISKDLFYPRLGIDISAGMLRKAIARGCPALLANCLAPPIADHCIGLVTAYSFLHHFKEPFNVLDQMVRVLRPGGWLVIDWEPNRAGYPKFISLLFAKLKHPELWGRKRACEDSPELKRANEVAEYYEVMHPGLDAEALAEHLTMLKFQVSVVYHSNAHSALPPNFRMQDRIRAILDGHLPTNKHSSVFFMLIAQKSESA